MIVTIDGPAGAGKSTVARAIAAKLGYIYLDTGALYRAIAWKALATGTDPTVPAAMKRLSRNIRLQIVHTPDGAKLIRNFVRKVAGLTGDWTMRAFRDEAIEKIRVQVGKGPRSVSLGPVDGAAADVRRRGRREQLAPGVGPDRLRVVGEGQVHFGRC